MATLGVVLVLAGAGLVVAEAHVPGGVFGVVGGVALMVGGAVLLVGLGATAAVIVPVVLGIAVAVGGWTAIVARKAMAVRHGRAQAGAERLPGRLGVVRRWSEPTGQVFVDGALWRARCEWTAMDDALEVGDPVVVERVSGLTLSVRRAEDWELLT